MILIFKKSKIPNSLFYFDSSELRIKLFGFLLKIYFNIKSYKDYYIQENFNYKKSKKEINNKIITNYILEYFTEPKVLEDFFNNGIKMGYFDSEEVKKRMIDIEKYHKYGLDGLSLFIESKENYDDYLYTFDFNVPKNIVNKEYLKKFKEEIEDIYNQKKINFEIWYKELSFFQKFTESDKFFD